MVAQVLWSLEVAFSGSMSVSSFATLVVCRRHFARASNVLVTLNSAANFIIYCMCSRSFRAVLVNRCFRCCRRSKLLTANRSGQVGFDVRDGRNDVHPRRRFLTVRRDPQTSSSSRRHVSDERLLPSARQPIDVDRHHTHAGANSNEVVEMKLRTDCNIQVTSQPYD